MLPPKDVSPLPLKSAPSNDRNDAHADMNVSRRVLFGFLLAALATVLIGIATYWSSTERERAVARLGNAQQSIQWLQKVTRTLVEAESGQRGFLLSGEPRYLSVYEIAVTKLPEQLDSLRRTLNNREALAQSEKELESLVQAKLDELDQPVKLHRSGDAKAALDLMRSGHGQATMEKLRQVSEGFATDLQQRADERRDEWRNAASWSAWVIGAGSALLLVLIGMAAAMTAREQATKARQSWVDRGVLGLGVQLQGDHALDSLGEVAMHHLAGYMGAQVGAAYVVRGAQRLELFGAYALDSQHAIGTMVPGEGLLGEALRSGALHHVREVPEGYMRVTSATGSATPRELLLMPAVFGGRVSAVMELGFFRSVRLADKELLKRASEMLGLAIRSALDRSELERLLRETQRQSEQLQTQQEELRVSNEELEQQSRSLQASQAQMELQQTELEQTNAQLEEQTSQLEEQREKLLMAQEVLSTKARELELASQYKSEFLANMSHELRTPLNSSLILAKLLGDNKTGNLSPEQVKYAQTIYAAGNDLLVLINDILDLAKIESGQADVDIETVPTAKTLAALLDPLRPLAGQKGLTLASSIDSNVPAHLETDPRRLGQILKNLLSNAIKFTQNGAIEVHVGMATTAASPLRCVTRALASQRTSRCWCSMPFARPTAARIAITAAPGWACRSRAAWRSAWGATFGCRAHRVRAALSPWNCPCTWCRPCHPPLRPHRPRRHGCCHRLPRLSWQHRGAKARAACRWWKTTRALPRSCKSWRRKWASNARWQPTPPMAWRWLPPTNPPPSCWT